MSILVNNHLFLTMETCIKEDTDYQRFYSGKVTSVGDVITMKVNTVVRGTLVNFDTYYQMPNGLALGAKGAQCLSHLSNIHIFFLLLRPASKGTQTIKDFNQVK